MNILLIANMAASQQAFELLQKQLEANGHFVHAHLSAGKLSLEPELVTHEVSWADAVVLGMSSQPDISTVEMAVADECLKQKKRFGFYADTFGSFRRSWLQELLLQADFLWVVTPQDRDEANRLIEEHGSQTEVVWTGNPVWELFLTKERPSFQKVREVIGIAEVTKLVLVPFGKNAEINLLHAQGVIDACDELIQSNFGSFAIVIALHPGDKNPASAYAGFELHGLGGEDKVDVKLITKDVMSSSDLLSGADIVVGSASGIGVEAAFLKKPCIDFFTGAALERLEKSTGSPIWPPCEIGASMLVIGSVEYLHSVMNTLLFDETSRSQQRHLQEEAFPSTTDVLQSALALMQEVLEDLGD